jgi:hypothetical protein
MVKSDCSYSFQCNEIARPAGLEPAAFCLEGSCKKSILLIRLALFYVMVHGFGPNLAVLGPKLDPSFLCN